MDRCELFINFKKYVHIPAGLSIDKHIVWQYFDRVLLLHLLEIKRAGLTFIFEIRRDIDRIVIYVNMSLPNATEPLSLFNSSSDQYNTVSNESGRASG